MDGDLTNPTPVAETPGNDHGKLTEDQQAFIVAQLAMWRAPTEIVELVKEEFGVEVTRQAVHYYNPQRKGGESIPERWRTLFDDTREAYRKAAADIGIANQVFRLDQLMALYRKALAQGRGNLPLAAQLLKQAAEETGGQYTNHRVLEHQGEIKTGGVLLVPPPASGPEGMREWMKQARDAQVTLERDAATAAAEVLGSDGAASQP